MVNFNYTKADFLALTELEKLIIRKTFLDQKLEKVNMDSTANLVATVNAHNGKNEPIFKKKVKKGKDLMTEDEVKKAFEYGDRLLKALNKKRGETMDE